MRPGLQAKWNMERTTNSTAVLELLGCTHDGSMGRTVYLPTWMVDFYGKCIGKYTIHVWMECNQLYGWKFLYWILFSKQMHIFWNNYMSKALKGVFFKIIGLLLKQRHLKDTFQTAPFFCCNTSPCFGSWFRSVWVEDSQRLHNPLCKIHRWPFL